MSQDLTKRYSTNRAKLDLPCV